MNDKIQHLQQMALPIFRPLQHRHYRQNHMSGTQHQVMPCDIEGLPIKFRKKKRIKYEGRHALRLGRAGRLVLVGAERKYSLNLIQVM